MITLREVVEVVVLGKKERMQNLELQKTGPPVKMSLGAYFTLALFGLAGVLGVRYHGIGLRSRSREVRRMI